MEKRYLNFSEDDIDVNRYVANLLLVVVAIYAGSLTLTLLNVFYIRRDIIVVGTILMSVLIGTVQVLGRVRRVSRKPITKYVIMAIAIVVTFMTEVLLSFFALLALVIPLIVAMSYHSRKLVTMAMVGTVLCALLAPIVGLEAGMWPVDYFIFLARCVDNTILQGTAYEKSKLATDWERIARVTVCVSLPMTAICGIYGIGIRYSIRQKQESYNDQVRRMTNTQDTIIRGMSDVVENRDSSTGGHVKRTSEVVAILIEKLKQDDAFVDRLTDEFCVNVIKTAPMHDLGKIAIEDAILTKPGKLTGEEFAKIKTHPKKSCDIIESILSGVSDTALRETAKNIALYHHEWFNGNGYPSGISGDSIPLEARIMAIADVYDALVSKRCYKASMSHECAYRTIREEMGTHFDPELWPCFEMAYPELAKYYDNVSDT